MAIGDVIVGIDIGTSKISLVIGEVNNFNQLDILCTSTCRCKGVKKGKIVDEEEIVAVLVKLIKEAEIEHKMTIKSSYLTVPGKYVTIVQNTIVKDAKDKVMGISSKDVQQALAKVKDIDIPDGQQIVEIVANEFVLEDGLVVKDPVGRISRKFTLKAQIVLAEKEYVRQLIKLLKKADIDIDGLIPTILAQRSNVLDANELKDNVLLLDIGAGNTEIGIFEGDTFVYTNSIPLGGDTITKDISFVLECSEDEAEKLKRQYGLALKSYIDNDAQILLATVKDENKRIIKSSELIEIMGARIDEIFSLVNNDISRYGINRRVNKVVLTGQGIVNINKSDVAAKSVFGIHVKMENSRNNSIVRPEYKTAYSLINYIAARSFSKSTSSNIYSNTKESVFQNMLERIKDFFYS